MPARNNRLLPLFLFSFLIQAGDSLAQEAPPIVNGQKESGFDSVVGLGAGTDSSAFVSCTGNLITPRIVLTAAHCGDNFPLELVVQFGKAFFGRDSDDIDIAAALSDAAFHPEYEANANASLTKYDAGILVLEQEAPIEPTAIWSGNLKQVPLGQEMKSVGWGTDAGDGTGRSGIKRSADLTLDSKTKMFLVSESATNPNSANICSGDSGGPVFIEQDGRWIQAGVHSWGDNGCEVMGGSTRLDTIRPWVLERVEAVHGTTDFCEINGHYSNGICETFCEEVDPDCLEDTGDSGLDNSEEPLGGCACSSTPKAPQSMSLVVSFLLLVFGYRRRPNPTSL